MDYIDQSKYNDLLKRLSGKANQGILKEGLENEGNAFTKQLATHKPGESFKVGNKQFKDTAKKQIPERNLGGLSLDEREKLREYINSVKTIKAEIKKMLSKTGSVEESGDNTGKMLHVTELAGKSSCCGAEILPGEVCADCGEHCASDGSYEPMDEVEGLSHCCGAPILPGGVCSDCGEECERDGDDYEPIKEDEKDDMLDAIVAKYDKDQEGEEAVKGQYDPY